MYIPWSFVKLTQRFKEWEKSQKEIQSVIRGWNEFALHCINVGPRLTLSIEAYSAQRKQLSPRACQVLEKKGFNITKIKDEKGEEVFRITRTK